MDKIICLGKNFREHAEEMKEGILDKPVLFLKPPSVLIEPKKNSSLVLPWNRGTIHHELELVFKLYKKNIIGLGVGLDLTLRDLQKELKSKGHPWEISKVFKNSAIISEIKGVRDFNNWQGTPYQLFINGELRQEARIKDAIMGPDAIIHHADSYFPICDGDLIYTGTPAGVGPLKPGDEIEMRFGPISTSFRLSDFG